jgi:hypothetical protein
VILAHERIPPELLSLDSGHVEPLYCNPQIYSTHYQGRTATARVKIMKIIIIIKYLGTFISESFLSHDLG